MQINVCLDYYSTLAITRALRTHQYEFKHTTNRHNEAFLDTLTQNKKARGFSIKKVFAAHIRLMDEAESMLK